MFPVSVLFHLHTDEHIIKTRVTLGTMPRNGPSSSLEETAPPLTYLKAEDSAHRTLL
jgi:hypothetical protein